MTFNLLDMLSSRPGPRPFASPCLLRSHFAKRVKGTPTPLRLSASFLGLSGDDIPPRFSALARNLTFWCCSPMLPAALAARRGDLQALARSLRDVGNVGEDGRTALMHAALGGDLSCVSLLLPREAGVLSVYGETAFSLAVMENNVAVARVLEPYEARIDCFALRFSLRRLKDKQYLRHLLATYENLQRIYDGTDCEQIVELALSRSSMRSSPRGTQHGSRSDFPCDPSGDAAGINAGAGDSRSIAGNRESGTGFQQSQGLGPADLVSAIGHRSQWEPRQDESLALSGPPVEGKQAGGFPDGGASKRGAVRLPDHSNSPVIYGELPTATSDDFPLQLKPAEPWNFALGRDCIPHIVVPTLSHLGLENLKDLASYADADELAADVLALVAEDGGRSGGEPPHGQAGNSRDTRDPRGPRSPTPSYTSPTPVRSAASGAHREISGTPHPLGVNTTASRENSDGSASHNEYLPASRDLKGSCYRETGETPSADAPLGEGDKGELSQITVLVPKRSPALAKSAPSTSRQADSSPAGPAPRVAVSVETQTEAPAISEPQEQPTQPVTASHVSASSPSLVSREDRLLQTDALIGLQDAQVEAQCETADACIQGLSEEAPAAPFTASTAPVEVVAEGVGPDEPGFGDAPFDGAGASRPARIPYAVQCTPEVADFEHYTFIYDERFDPPEAEERLLELEEKFKSREAQVFELQKELDACRRQLALVKRKYGQENEFRGSESSAFSDFTGDSDRESTASDNDGLLSIGQMSRWRGSSRLSRTISKGSLSDASSMTDDEFSDAKSEGPPGFPVRTATAPLARGFPASLGSD